MKHLLLRACIYLGSVLPVTNYAQTGMGSTACPNLSGCTYVPLRYFTFDNSGAPFKDCIQGADSIWPYNLAQQMIHSSSPGVGSYERLITAANERSQIFSGNFFPNGDYVNSKEYTFEFMLRINTALFEKVSFSIRGFNLFYLGQDNIGFLAEHDTIGSTAPLVSRANPLLTGQGRLSTGYFMDKEWHHIACKFDGNNGFLELWIDGESATELRTAIPIGSVPHAPASGALTDKPIIDMRCIDAGSFDIDEIAFYDQALPADLIYQHYLNTQNGQHYDCVPDPSIVAPTPVSLLTGTYDPLDFVPGHPFSSNQPVTTDDLGTASVVPLVITQFRSFPLPRYRKQNGLNPNINWMNNEYLGRINKIVNATNDIAVQEQLCKNWNYMFSLNPNTNFPSSYPAALNNFANTHTQYKYSVSTNINFASTNLVPDSLNSDPACPGRKMAPNENTRSYFRGLGNNALTRMLANIIYDTITPLTNEIDYISENGFEYALFFLLNNGGCPYNSSVNTALNLFPNTFSGAGAWQSYYGECRNKLESAYRDEILGKHAYLNQTKYSKYLVSSVYEHTDAEDYAEMRSVNTPFQHNGHATYYSTPSFYIRSPKVWRKPPSGVEWGWMEIIENPINSSTYGGRKREILLGDSLFAPFVAAGWQNEHENVRPGQWLGLLKGLGVLGADYYHTGYFNVTDPASKYATNTYDPVDPRGWCYQAVMPSYAQGITSRFEKYLHASDIAYHKMMNMTLFVARHLSGTTKYLLYGSVQQLSNFTGNTPLSMRYAIADPAAGTPLNGMAVNIRRQGSTYIYDSSTNVFYQLDKWHESTHPSYWSRDFEFEAELNDYTQTNTLSGANDLINNTMALKTEVPPSAKSGDFTDYITYVEYKTGTPTTSFYYFEPRNAASSGTKTYYLWVRARATYDALWGQSKMTMSLRPTGASTPLKEAFVSCINNTDNSFKWYNFGIPTDSLGVTTKALSFVLTQNQEYEIAFEGNPYVQFDKFIITDTSGVPVGVDTAEIVTPCTYSNRMLSGLAGEESIAENLAVYPNPSNGNFFVRIEGDQQDKNFIKEIRVLNTQGLVVYQQRFAANSTREAEIFLGKNKHGMYILETNTTNALIRTKILITE